MAESEEELKSLLRRVKVESEKSGLKLIIKKAKIMVSGSITSWQIEGKRWKQWQISSSWSLKSLQMVTAAMKSEDVYFLAGKWWQNLDSVLKSRDVTLPTKVCIVKAMVFPVVTYGCESWMVKKPESQRIDAFNYGAGEDSWESLGQQDQASWS